MIFSIIFDIGPSCQIVSLVALTFVLLGLIFRDALKLGAHYLHGDVAIFFGWIGDALVILSAFKWELFLVACLIEIIELIG